MNTLRMASEVLPRTWRPAAPLTPPREEALSMHALLRGVPPATVEQRLLACPTLALVAGQALIRSGDVRGELYVVLAGRLAVTVGGVRLATVPEGQTVGELGVLEPQAACADVVAEVPSRVLVMDATTFWALVSDSPQVAVNMLRMLAARVRQSTTQIGTVEAQRFAMEALSRTDALTGLANRRWLDDTLPRLFARAARDRSALSLVLFDLDHFKSVNDRFGHGTGDRVLVAIADALRRLLRPTDLVARLGGEEFLVALPDTSIDSARLVAERIRREVCGLSFLDDEGRTIDAVTISAGVSSLRADDPEETPRTLLTRADARLYEAKHGGRDRTAG